MQCSNCGTQNLPDARFCRRCGQPLVASLPIENAQSVDWLPVPSLDTLGMPSQNLVSVNEVEARDQPISLVPLLPSDKIQRAIVPIRQNLPTLRPGCDYCFQTTNSHDENQARRALVKCSQCGALYHQRCWEQIEKCLRCGGSEIVSIELAPPSLYARNKTKSLSITPTAVAYSLGEVGVVLPNSVMEFLGWYYKTVSNKVEKFLSNMSDSTQGESSNFIRGNIHFITPITVFAISITLLIISVCLCVLLAMIF